MPLAPATFELHALRHKAREQAPADTAQRLFALLALEAFFTLAHNRSLLAAGGFRSLLDKPATEKQQIAEIKNHL